MNRYQELRRALKMEELMQQAQTKAALSDYGDERFAEPLSKLLDCVARDTNFSAAGLKAYKDDIIRILVNRLRFQNDLKRHPEILDEDVSDPIVILGLPRSGTTKTQRMMGTDPNLLKTYKWQLLNPAPFPDIAADQPDPRIAAAHLGDNLAEGHAEVQAGHHHAADGVDGDSELFEVTFNDWLLNSRTPSRQWHDWVFSRTEPSDLENYHYVRSLIQYLQWQQGGRKNRRWLMKHIGHVGHMEELLDTYPKATLMHIHRNPVVSIASLAKLVFGVWSLRVDNLHPEFVGEFVFQWQKTMIDRYLVSRDRLGLDGRVLDVQYEQIRTDPIPVFREIYRRAGHTLTAESERGMLQWEKDNEQGKHGKHAYSLEKFGLSEQKIDDAFGEYIRRFIK